MLVNPTDPTILHGRRVLVVEDEALVAMVMEHILEDLGCAIIGPAGTVEEALRLLETEAKPDLAVLDVNLGGTKVFPVAEVLARLHVPFAFSTGYGEGGIPDEWRSRPALRKPYAYEDVVTGLGSLVAQGSAV